MTDPRQVLTQCALILADEKHESGLAGQITARGPIPNTYWTLPLGLSFDEATPASWLLIDDQMRLIEGEGAHGIREPNPATRFHLWVYRSRPDVNAIVGWQGKSPPGDPSRTPIGHFPWVCHLTKPPLHRGF